MRLQPYLLLAGLLLQMPALVLAQPSPQWGLTGFYTYEALNNQRPAWQILQLSLQRRFSKQTLILDGALHQRFGHQDIALGVEAWQDLWAGAYGNLRIQTAPGSRFLPRLETYAELYQATGPWELAVSLRGRFHPGDFIPIGGVALARYEGNWYLRTRTLLAALAGHVNWVQTFMARRYWDPPQSFFDLQAGYGRGVEIIDVGPVLQSVRTYFIALRMQRFVTRTLGVSFGLSYSNDDLFTRRGATVGLLRRW